VFVLGNVEGAMPPAGRDDSLLPEELRRAAGLDGHAIRRRDERRDYLAALAAASERVLLYPRADIRGQRARLPGQWLLESASALAGRRIFASRLQELHDAPWFREVASFEAALQMGPPSGEQEYDLRSLRAHRAAGEDIERHYLGATASALGHGWELQRARRSSAFTRWDGLAPGALPRAPLSPTALQHWAACPFRFFLAQVLHVSEQEEPEDVLVISALERGSPIHAVLDRFFKTVRPRSTPEEPWSEADRALLREIAREECDAAEAGGIAGRALLWDLERDRILDDLDRLLTDDEAMRARLGVVQVASELAFGLDGEPPLEVALPGGRRLLLRGRIDRLDRSPDGRRVRVVDYKTGRVRPEHEALADDPVHRGQLLQLPIYGLAARGLEVQQPDEVLTHYWFATHHGGFTEHGYVFDARREARFLDVLDMIARGIEDGTFPAHPGAPMSRGPEHCLFCPYGRICPTDRARSWERKRGDSMLAEYVALAEPDGDE
jgi:RecB family exonuclease